MLFLSKILYVQTVAYTSIFIFSMQAQSIEFRSNGSNDGSHSSNTELSRVTPTIIYAIEKNDLPLFKEMLKACVDVNKNVNKIRPLLAAIYQKNEEMVVMLLNAGAILPRKVTNDDGLSMSIEKFLKKYATLRVRKLLQERGIVHTRAKHYKAEQLQSNSIGVVNAFEAALVVINIAAIAAIIALQMK